MNRIEEFAQIRWALGEPVQGTPEALVVVGDSLPNLRLIPDSSISLILTDPPYHSTKKANIAGDTAFAEDEHFLNWMEMYVMEWKRILKMSGTIYLFCSSVMSARLEVMISKYFRPLSHITWTKPNEPGYDGWKGKMKKESLRTWYPHSERILMFEHGGYGSWEAYRRSPVGEYLLARRKQAGMSMVELTEQIGEYGKINRGGAVANWEAGRNIPSREQYGKLKAVLENLLDSAMLEYDDVIRPMNVSGDIEYTDTWDFASVRPFQGKHPAEKPQDMLEHIISASSRPGDVVLDCFAGSGSTGVAAVRLGRRAICMELEAQWVQRALADLAQLKPGDPAPVQPRRAKSPGAIALFA